jgi:hypothetical protein
VRCLHPACGTAGRRNYPEAVPNGEGETEKMAKQISLVGAEPERHIEPERGIQPRLSLGGVAWEELRMKGIDAE